MKTYLQQAKSLLDKTIRGSIIVTFLFCLIFALIDFLLLMATHPRNHSLIDFPVFLAYIFSPVLVIVILDGMLIGTFISWMRNKLSGFMAILLGLAVGSTLAFAGNYIVWLNSDTTERMLFYPSLLDFMLYSFTNFFRAVFFVNIFFIPTTFSILVSTYLGWKMNSSYIPETTDPTQE